MAGYKTAFLETLSGVATRLPTAYLQKLSGQRLILPFYHGISKAPVPHIDQLYSPKSVAAFIEDLDFLLRHYSPLSYTDFVAIQEGGEPLKKPSFLLSFDDGLRSFHDIVAPILLQKGIPAICFLNAAFVDNRGLFYRYKASLLLHFLAANPSAVGTLHKWGYSRGSNYKSWLLGLGYQDTLILDKLAAQLGLSFQDFLQSEQPYLNSSEIRQLIEQGFYFGAHSIDHPNYQKLALDEQLRQTRESVGWVADTFRLPYRIFSFPFTDYQVSSTFFQRLQTEGIAQHTFGCAGQKQEILPRHFQRIPFEQATYSGRTILNTELLYYLAKAPLGKNKIYRHA